MNTNLLNIVASFLLIATAIILIFTSYQTMTRKAPTQVPIVGNGDTSLVALAATSSVAAVGTTAITVIATSTCTSRTISTTGTSPIQITFNDKYVPTGSFGHWQGSSTTVSYLSGVVGCGALKVFSYVPQTITITDSR